LKFSVFLNSEFRILHSAINPNPRILESFITTFLKKGWGKGLPEKISHPPPLYGPPIHRRIPQTDQPIYGMDQIKPTRRNCL